jgi:hypothetical protein
MNRPLSSAIPTLLGALLWQVSVSAQPEVNPDKPGRFTYSITELERFLGGRTLLKVDLKEATLDQVAAALTEASGQKIVVAPATRRVMGGLEAETAAPGPTFNLKASDKPFWQAIRDWQIEARRADDAAKAAKGEGGNTFVDWGGIVPNSVQVKKVEPGFQLEQSNILADGRGVAAWPFLLIGTDLRRVQDARLSETGLRELVPFVDYFDSRQAVQSPVAVAKTPAPEEKRWDDKLIFSLSALPDPKLVPAGLRCEVVEAIDDKGNDLRLPNATANRFGGSSFNDLGAGSPLQIALASRPSMGKRLVKLRGVLHFNVVTRTQHWETTDFTTPVEDTLRLEGGEFKIRFAGLVPSGDGWRLTFEADSTGSHLKQFWNKRYEARRQGFVGPAGILDFTGVPAMQLVDDRGRIFQYRNSGGTAGLHPRNQPEGVAALPASPDLSPVPPDVAQTWKYDEARVFTFSSPSGRRVLGLNPGKSPIQDETPPPMGKPVKLSVDFPVERREVSVPFEFTDLPLPPS